MSWGRAREKIHPAQGPKAELVWHLRQWPKNQHVFVVSAHSLRRRTWSGRHKGKVPPFGHSAGVSTGVATNVRAEESGGKNGKCIPSASLLGNQILFLGNAISHTSLTSLGCHKTDTHQREDAQLPCTQVAH